MKKTERSHGLVYGITK